MSDDASFRQSHTRAVGRKARLDPSDPTRVREVTVIDNQFNNSIEAQAYLDSLTPKYAGNRTLMAGRRLKQDIARDSSDD